MQRQHLTAARVGEVAGARWDELDENTALWTIPAERSKNKRAHRLPLSEHALEVLREARPLDPGTGAVFPTQRRGNPVHPSTVSNAVRANLAHFGVAAFTPHDLRRTVATGLSESGTSRVVVGKVLNHIDPSVTAIYDRYEYMKEMRAALEAWGHRLMALKDGRRLSLVG